MQILMQGYWYCDTTQQKNLVLVTPVGIQISCFIRLGHLFTGVCHLCLQIKLHSISFSIYWGTRRLDGERNRVARIWKPKWGRERERAPASREWHFPLGRVVLGAEALLMLFYSWVAAFLQWFICLVSQLLKGFGFFWSDHVMCLFLSAVIILFIAT